MSFSDAVDRERLAAYLNEAGVDVLIAGPIVSLGMIGGGTPDEVALFEAHLAALRELLERPLLVVLLHHTNQRGQISGAWDRVPDTLLLVVNTGKATRLRWEKARNSSALHATSWKLKWSDGLTFELDETPDTTEDEIEEGLLASALANPGEGWRTIAKSVRGNARDEKRTFATGCSGSDLVNLGTGSAMRIHHADDVEPDVLEQITLSSSKSLSTTRTRRA